MEHSIEINQLNQELQQLMIGGNRDKGAQRISPARKISPPKEQAGHDVTPYSRGGPRKFVSRAERRRSSDSPLEEAPQLVTDRGSDGFERTAPYPPPPPAEPVKTRSSVETSPERQTGTSMSYSAVLKSASQEATKSGPTTAKPNQSKTFSRPPPGFPPLPTHGGDTKMNMTVLSTKTRTKPPGQPSSAPRNTPTRADASMNWRNDSREEQLTQVTTRPTNPSQSGHAVKWKQFDAAVGQRMSPPKPGGFSEASTQRRETPIETMGSANSDESPEPPPVVHAHRAFGPGGLKACVICGSKDHLRCNDRSKMFMD